MAEEKKIKYKIKEGYRIGMAGAIYESGVIVELTLTQAKLYAEYIEPAGKNKS